MNCHWSLVSTQKFNLKVYEDEVKTLSQEQAQEFLLELLRQLMVKENVIKHLLKESVV
ncbi:NblA/ycf18 family protein [Kovacikia minuta CCNUW1]|uniref:NblA/ycf18 family protein n=1 Tax=Kovacikia minuta TaxID=2931930 RepID=UPI001CCCF93E|nr:NblA/ycf18 family protein [Kovacikia minuta]UBF29668.1 NblA/ycf18 family protein [Kovacikia minuta CCNUW1]